MTRDRDETQADLDKLAAGMMQHRLSQPYTVADRLEERAREEGERVFILYGDHRFTYAEVDALESRVANALAELGVREGDVAALMMENRPEFIAAWAGMAKLGVSAALLNTHVRGRALAHALETTHAKHLVVGSECLANIESAGADAVEHLDVHVWRDAYGGGTAGGGAESEELPDVPDAFDDFDLRLAHAPAEAPDTSVRAGLRGDSDLFHIFTSGTTGLPKAARLSHMRFLGVGDGMSAVAGYGPDEVIACVLPLYHGAAGMVVVSCALSQGAAVAIQRRFSASRFWDDARRHGVTAWQYIGEICRYLLNQPVRDDDRDHSLRVMMGAGLGADIWEEFRDRFGIERILEGWSSTEANTNLINVDGRPGACGRVPYPDRHNGRLVRFDPETEEHVRGEDGFLVECGPGEVGEFIGMILDLPDLGAGRFEGYTSADETEKKILRNVFAEGDAWYRSGDLLRYDEEGYFYFVDRIGDTFRWKSENVSTLEVAEVLAGFPGLQIANVYGVKVPGAEGRAGMAALVVADPAGFDGKAFFDFTGERLPEYAAPVFVRLAGEADMTSTFKLRKIDLVRDGYDLSSVTDPLYVRDPAARAYVPLTAERARDPLARA